MNKINIYLISKFMGLKLFGIENYLQEKKSYFKDYKDRSLYRLF